MSIKIIVRMGILLVLAAAACTPIAPNLSLPVKDGRNFWVQETEKRSDQANELQPTTPAVEIRFYVKPETVECSGEGAQECLVVRQDEADEWEYFYDFIEGFVFERGFAYEILVQRTEVTEPPADGSAYRYTLLKIVEKMGAPLDEDENPLAGTIWDLVGFGDPDDLTRPLKGSLITLDFEEGRVVGRAGCNAYGTEYLLKSNRIEWAEPFFTMTKMLCAEPMMRQEAQYTALLGLAETFSLDDGVLSIHTSEGVLVFAAPESASLTGVDWILTGIASSDGIISTWIDESITARFTATAIDGFSGCNGYNGGIEITGDEIAFGPLMSTLMACEKEVMEREYEFLSAFANASCFKIERQVLTIQDAAGEALLTFRTSASPAP